MSDPMDTYLAIGSILFIVLICLTVFVRILIDSMRINNDIYRELV